MTTTGADYAGKSPEGAPRVGRRAGAAEGYPAGRVNSRPGPARIFDSDEELEEFLTHVYGARHADLAKRCRRITSSSTRTWHRG
jgi:hypothetical protein